MPRGVIYVLTNRAMPGLIKVGFSTRSAESRAAELSATGVPLPFEVVFSAEVEAPSQVEAEIHARFAQYRISNSREFFQMTVDDAITELKAICSTRDASNDDPCDLSPWSALSDSSYLRESSKYYPQSVSVSFDDASNDQTWYPDSDFVRTRKGQVACPNCGHGWPLDVGSSEGFLPPISLPCERCRKTIFIR